MHLITHKRPSRQIAEQVKNAQETLGFQKNSVENSPWGGKPLLASLFSHHHQLSPRVQVQGFMPAIAIGAAIAKVHWRI